MALVVSLQDKDTWPLVILRVVLYHHSVCHSCNDIAHKHTILGQRIISRLSFGKRRVVPVCDMLGERLCVLIGNVLSQPEPCLVDSLP
jgi:hypothetical protein